MNTASNHLRSTDEPGLTRAQAPAPAASSVSVGAESRQTLVALLGQILVDGLDLNSQVKQAHWTVRGPHFIAYHLLFDELSERLREWMDEIAERSVALCGTVRATTREIAGQSQLPEYPTGITSGPAHITALVERYTAFAGRLRAALTTEHVDDPVSNDLLTEVLRGVELDLWKLDSHRD